MCLRNILRSFVVNFLFYYFREFFRGKMMERLGRGLLLIQS